MPGPAYNNMCDALPPVFRKAICIFERLWCGDSTRELSTKTITIADELYVNEINADSGDFVINDGVRTRVFIGSGPMRLYSPDGGTFINLEDGAITINSTTAALVQANMTTTQRDALTAVNGMMIYNTSTDKFQGYENGAWVNVV